jgi:membrane associated rhomboid family serine protease/Flp pilus assembly protein TadD
LATCLQCGTTLSAVSVGELSDYCDGCKQTQQPAKKRDLIDDLPQLSASADRWRNATTLLLGINCAVFVAMVATGVSALLPTTDQLLRWGADYGPYTLGGEYWRLITSSFLHIGIVHLAVNMWCLWRLGRMLEKLLGFFSTIGVYLLTGIGAGLLSLSWDPMRVSAGASGALFGIVGVLISMLYTAKLDIPSDRLHKLRNYVTRLAIYNLLYGLLGGIDNMAHLGGLVTGLIIGYLLARSFVSDSAEHFPSERPIMLGTMIMLLVVLIPVTKAKGYAVEMQRGQTALAHNDYAAAITHYRRYTSVRSDDAYGHAVLGFALHKSQRYNEAASEYRRALELQPDYAEIQLDLAEAYVADGQFHQALPIFSKYISQAGSDSEAYLAYGQALIATGSYREAETPLRKAISLDANNPDPYFELAKALSLMGAKEEAHRIQQQALKLGKKE